MEPIAYLLQYLICVVGEQTNLDYLKYASENSSKVRNL